MATAYFRLQHAAERDRNGFALAKTNETLQHLMHLPLVCADQVAGLLSRAGGQPLLDSRDQAGHAIFQLFDPVELLSLEAVGCTAGSGVAAGARISAGTAGAPRRGLAEAGAAARAAERGGEAQLRIHERQAGWHLCIREGWLLARLHAHLHDARRGMHSSGSRWRC